MQSDILGFPPGRRMFYLAGIGEPRDNQLKLLLLESRAEGLTEHATDYVAISRVQPIRPGEALALFWPTYVSYAVRNESYVYDLDAPRGDMLAELSESVFRDFVARATQATDEYPGVLRHFQVFCLNHVVDVISTHPPAISLEAIDAEG